MWMICTVILLDTFKTNNFLFCFKIKQEKSLKWWKLQVLNGN